MKHNKFDLKVGDIVILDKGFNNSSEVEIVGFTPEQMYTNVKSLDDDRVWVTMTNRLTPKI